MSHTHAHMPAYADAHMYIIYVYIHGMNSAKKITVFKITFLDTSLYYNSFFHFFI